MFANKEIHSKISHKCMSKTYSTQETAKRNCVKPQRNLEERNVNEKNKKWFKTKNKNSKSKANSLRNNN